MNEAEANWFYRDVAAILHDVATDHLNQDPVELRKRLTAALHGAADRQCLDPPIKLVIREGEFENASRIISQLAAVLEPGSHTGILLIPVEATR